jgi:hypothetical protein
MIHVNLKGRLGNKLFQIATAIALAEENNTKISVNEASLLEYFNIDADMQTAPNHFITYSEPGFEYNKIPYTSNMILDGYFQSEKYFKDYKKQILEQLSLKQNLCKALIEKYKKLTNGFQTISIHIRRGDYLTLANHYTNLNINYYKAAIAKFKLQDTKILIFSDDIKWCKKYLVGNKFIFIEGNSNIEDLFLMSLCNNNIIANSSFSWWGSYLNKNLNKRVIAPSKWFGEGYKDLKTEDLYCDNWEIVTVE